MMKEEIEALELEIIQTGNSIRSEKKVIGTLEKLVQRSKDNISNWEGSINNLEDKLFGDFITTLRQTENFNLFLDLEKSPGETFADCITASLKEGLNCEGLRLIVPRNKTSQRINMKKLAERFQVLLNQYYNGRFWDSPYRAVIYINDKREAQYTIDIYLDTGI